MVRLASISRLHITRLYFHPPTCSLPLRYLGFSAYHVQGRPSLSDPPRSPNSGIPANPSPVMLRTISRRPIQGILYSARVAACPNRACVVGRRSAAAEVKVVGESLALYRRAG